MAEDALGLSIINLLKTKANHCIELKDISRQLKIHKKELNVELYRLKRQGILNKVQESPPVWQLNSTSSGIHLPLRPKHSRKKYEKEFHRGGKTGGYRHGHSFGQKRKKKTTHNTELINGIIHYLQDKTGPVKSVDIARAVGKSTSSEINPSLYFLQKQNAIMKVLEKPVSWIINSGWKQPYPSSLVDSTLDLTNQKDVLLGQNSGSYNVLNLNTECDDQETPIHFPGFGSMDTLDRSLAIGNQNSPNIDIGGLNMNSPGHEVNVQFGDNDQEHNFPTPSFSDQMFIEEMELGGDIFGSEDNELSKSESDILDSLQDSSDVTEVSKDTEATTSDIDVSIDQSVSELQLPVSSNENVTDATSSETETDSTAESNSQEPASVLLSVQTEEDESDLVLTEMDELLKAMLNCPMQSAKLFILESKLKYSSGKVTDLLNKCKEKKFVNYHDPLWIMTPFGVDYIKGILAKIGQSSNVKTFFIQPSQPSIPKSTKTTFKGPPPSPFELLQKESSNIKTSLSSSDSNPSYSSISHQKCDHSSVPKALGQSVPPHNIIPSLNQQSSSSSREPVPLMSLNFNSSSSIGRGTEKFNQLQSKDSSSSTNSFPLQEDNISQGSTPKSLMSVDVSPFSSKNVLLNKNELPGRYPVGTEAPGRYPGPGPTQVPGSYPGTGSTGAPGSYPGLGPMQAPGSFPGTSPMQAPGSYPGRYQSPSETTGRYPVSSTVPERYPVPSEASNSFSSSVFEKDNSSLNLLITRNEQINQIFTKNKDCVPPSNDLSKQQSSSGSDTLHSQSQNTGCNLQTNQSTDMDTGVVLPAGHTESEHMPAYAKSILQSFSSGSTRFPTNDKMQQRKGIGQSSMFGRSPFSSSTSSGTINKTITSTSSGFKPPPSPFDLIKQQSNQAGNLHNTNVPPPSNIREDLARTAHQMIQNIPVSQNYVPSGSSSIFQQQPSVSSQIQIQSQLRGSSQMSSNLSGQSQMMGQRLTQPQSFPVMGNVAPLRQKTGPSSLDLTSESFAAVNKNPVSALMEYAQSRHKVARIEVIRQSGPSHRPRFLMGVFIGDQQIAAVECSNKKDGRREVADKALRALIASGQYNLPSTSANKPLVSAANMTHFDKIAALSHQAFNALVAGISENFAGRKVIAALVMKCSDTDVGTVVSVGSGNRCITGQQLSLEGNTVNDSHAEIITRRGFIRFLYKRLLAYDPNNSGDMFEKAPSGKLQIRNGITFHLYISTAPCGDGALFSPRDVSSNSGPILNVNDRIHHPTFTSQAQGLVRTKMEGGEGTIPVEKDFVIQTFDGIQRGERLRTMSCTDKICRWNVVGMQGALLSHFLEPIYLDSLTLGLLYDHGHLARALCCRVAHGEMDVDELLPRGYHLNHPWLGRVTACEPPREVQKTKALSINWCIGDERAEVTDGTLGLLYTKIEKGLFSRCSKKNLYDSFKKLCQKYGLSHLLQAKNYNEAKMMATDFQTAKSAMLKKFKENGYGHWVSKPIEEELFS